jgi:tRNA-uridine 2-sulfurtransferase
VKKKPKVFVGMSGGVDSSVSAALLKEQGYDVTGVFIKVWSPDWLPCTWKEERRDAMRVAAHLDIPFMTLDLEEEYKKGVVDYMLEEYKAGRTPNPDVMCNKEIKFGEFLKKALEMGAAYVATGHYAQNINNELHEGNDNSKDQSYFLWTLTQDKLKHILFPVGHLEKSEVRALAKKYKLTTAEKKDSQGICFIGKVDMREFLSHYIESKPGDVLNESGKKIGAHEGAVFYTIGQRHGFTISEKSPSDTPYYIVEKDIEKNTVTVSHKVQDNNDLKTVTTVVVSKVNWTDSIPDFTKDYSARLRYRQQKQTVSLARYEDHRLSQDTNQNNKIFTDSEKLVVTFSEPQGGVSIGQSVVLYDGTKCLGGGVIDEVL